MIRNFILCLFTILFIGCGQAPAAVMGTTTTGSVISQTSMAACNTAVNVKECRVTTTQSLTANLTLANDRKWVFDPGAVITTTGYTFDANGVSIDAGYYQIFSGSGTVTGLKLAIPEWFGTNTTPGTTDMTTAVQSALDSLPPSTADYGSGGGGVLKLSNVYGLSIPVKPKNRNITIEGIGPASSGFKSLPSFVGTSLLIIDPINHPSFVIFGNMIVRNMMFDHNDVAGIQSIIANSLNDGCVFSDIRSENFDGTVLTVGKSARVGAQLSQGLDVIRWNAISSGTDLVNDVFIVNEANEITFQSCKALGLSSGASTSVGFHIGKTATAQGVNLYNCSAAHLPGGTGIKYGTAWHSNDFGCTLENLAVGILFQGSSFSTNIENSSNYARFYSTVTHHVTIQNSTGASINSQENPNVLIESSAVNAIVRGTSNTAINTSVTNNSTTSTVTYGYKGGMVSGAARFTPVVTDGTNLATVSNSLGYVERVGNQYIARISVTITSIGLCTGNIQITGLPKTALTGVPVAATPIFIDWVTLGAGYTTGYASVGAGVSSILIRKTGTGVASAAINFADIRVGGNNTTIYITLVYEPTL